MLLDLLLGKIKDNNENSLLLYSDNLTVLKLLAKSKSLELEDKTVFVAQFKSSQEIKSIIETSGNKFDTIYIDDFDSFHLDFLDSIIELEEESLSSTILSENTKKTLSYLKELSKDISIFLVGHVSRRPDLRGGDHMPRISDIESPLLEKISSKLLLLYRPENYGFSCDEQGESIDDTIMISVPKNNEGLINIEFKHKIKGYNNT